MSETIFEARVFMSIPTSLITDILARLPPNEVIRCRCVCKAWLNLISEPEFVDLHLSKSPTCLIVHRLFGSFGNSAAFELVEVEDKTDHHSFRHIAGTCRVIPKGLNDTYMTMVGSIDGLVCIHEFGFESELIHVCNPYMKERITVQTSAPAGSQQYPNITIYGLGTRSGKYLVVRIFQKIKFIESGKQICDSTCHIYTIGDGVWKSIGHSPYLHRRDDRGFFFNGNFHWIISDKDSPEQICCLDLEKELFEPFPHPPEFVQRQRQIPTLNLYNGCLSVCEATSHNNIVIWVMKEYGVQNSWSKQVVMSEHGVVPDLFGDLHMIKVFKDGEILFLRRKEQLFSYHPQRKTVQYIDAVENMTGPQKIYPCMEATVYVSSIVSLKSLGEVNVSRRFLVRVGFSSTMNVVLAHE